MKLHLTGDVLRGWSWQGSIPAHGLHDVEEHGSCQVGAQVDEHGEDDHSQGKSLLIIFLQHSGTVPTPTKYDVF